MYECIQSTIHTQAGKDTHDAEKQRSRDKYECIKDKRLRWPSDLFPTRLTLLQKWNTHCQPNNKNQKLRENSVLIVFAICIQEIKTKPKSRMKLWLLCNGRVGNWAQNVCFSAARKYAWNEIEERFKLWQIARNEKHKQLRLVKWKSRRGLGLCLVPA